MASLTRDSFEKVFESSSTARMSSEGKSSGKFSVLKVLEAFCWI
jgi:hypothetical protein